MPRSGHVFHGRFSHRPWEIFPCSGFVPDSHTGVVPFLIPLGRGHPSLLGVLDSKPLKGWTHTNTHASPAKPPERAASTTTTP